MRIGYGKKRLRLAAGFLAGCFLLAFLAVPLPVSALSDEEVAAPSAILIDAGSGQVLYAKNAEEQRPCASITKVMTLLLVMEAIDEGKISLTDMVTTSEHAASMGGSDIWLKAGEEMSVDDLLKATVVMSANDAAVALAEHVSGSEDEFVERMNERARELGMDNTVFKNCNGLDEDGHVTTAHDVAIMSAELIKHEQIFDYTLIWMDYVRGGETQLVNTNRLIRTYKGITGLKTGTTSQAGSCISATAERDNLSLVAVVLGCSTTQERFSSATTLLDYGFANWAAVVPEMPELPAVPVTGGMQSQAEGETGTPGSLLIPKGKESALKSRVEMASSLQAPVEQGQTIGKVVFQLEGQEEILAEYPVTAKYRVEKVTFASSLWMLLQSLFQL